MPRNCAGNNTPDEPMCEVIYEVGRIASGKFDGEEVPVLINSWGKGVCLYFKTSQGIQKLFLHSGLNASSRGTFTVNGKPAKVTGRYDGNSWGYDFLDSKGQKHQALVNR